MLSEGRTQREHPCKGVHRKLRMSTDWTEPWEVSKILIPELSYDVSKNGRKIRNTGASAAILKIFHLRKAADF